jgi:hypothetical protein
MTRQLAILVLLSPACLALAGDVYQTPEEFLQEVFSGKPPDSQVLWLKDNVRQQTTAIMGHRYPGIRIRYWLKDGRSAWVLEEIGKERPITTGLVINAGRIEMIRVLAFRESRGGEVRYPFFTEQFSGIGLTANNRLDRDIDGISGATLSVRALEKLARLALYLHSQVAK